MYYITENEVMENLGMKETIDALDEAFSEYSKGKAASRPRERIIHNGVVYNTMPGIFEKYHLAGLKTYIASKNGARFVVMVFDTRNMDLLAVIEANRLGQVRTGALPAMVSSKIVRDRSPAVCIIGSGFQAETQLEGLLNVYDPERITIYSRTYRNVQGFAAKMSEKFGLEVIPKESVNEALEGARIVNTITDSNDAIFSRAQLGEAYHLNLCGGNIPARREVAEDALLDADLVIVEDMEQALRESGEIIGFRHNHPEKSIVELREFMAATIQSAGRTVFKSMGIGLEDIAAAHLVLKNMSLM